MNLKEIMELAGIMKALDEKIDELGDTERNLKYAFMSLSAFLSECLATRMGEPWTPNHAALNTELELLNALDNDFTGDDTPIGPILAKYIKEATDRRLIEVPTKVAM